MRTMNMPGLTAEASLFSMDKYYQQTMALRNMPRFTAEAVLSYKTYYQATEKAAAYSGAVQPAIFTLPLSTHLGPPVFLPCQKRVCVDVAPSGWSPIIVCRNGWGTWNPTNGRCE